MKPVLITTASVLLILTLAALALAQGGGAPAFIQGTFPEQGVDAAWQGYQSVFLDPEGALDTKSKELVALGVSAQVPCGYCVYYHTKAAQAQGATEAEIKEALAAAALVRKWSTILNGSQYSDEQWRREVDAMFATP